MGNSRRSWLALGLLAGVAGLATSYAASALLAVRDSPVTAVAETIIDLTPGSVVAPAIRLLGHWDKPVLVAGILAGLLAGCAYAGLLARRGWWQPAVVYAALAALGAVAVVARTGLATVGLLPIAIGFVTWLLVTSALAEPLRQAAADHPAPQSAPAFEPVTATPAGEGKPATARTGARRTFLRRAVLVGAGAALVAGSGRVWARGRRGVEGARRMLRLPLTRPAVPTYADFGLDGVAPWRTPNDEFYLIHTAISLPALDPADYRLRIHGMVDRPLTFSYSDLVERRLTESWITLNCVSNPVGGPLIGNAWWSGVRVADLLAEAGVREGADAVLQTSADGWTCGTPLAALTDSRDALLAVGMNGSPLPIEHGFPVRTIVPGLYGFVSACKWVVDLEVTRFERFTAYWTDKGWSEQAPVKLSSRIDVPRDGQEVPAGRFRAGGVAWAQHTGITAVEVAMDGGEWQPTLLASPPTDDTWVQWAVTVDLSAGEHELRVRATDKNGMIQTGVERDVVPDGATGWHTVRFTAG